MTRNRKISMASLFVILGGGTFLTSPAEAAAGAGTFDCRTSVTAYCQYVADNYCSTGATCWYNTQTCEVTNVECWES
ncbi:MAG TPA: hypothetical protein VGB24_17420 [Longimicrobium sp.]|jgi:hypothetical protein